MASMTIAQWADQVYYETKKDIVAGRTNYEQYSIDKGDVNNSVWNSIKKYDVSSYNRNADFGTVYNEANNEIDFYEFEALLKDYKSGKITDSTTRTNTEKFIIDYFERNGVRVGSDIRNQIGQAPIDNTDNTGNVNNGSGSNNTGSGSNGNEESVSLLKYNKNDFDKNYVISLKEADINKLRNEGKISENLANMLKYIGMNEKYLNNAVDANYNEDPATAGTPTYQGNVNGYLNGDELYHFIYGHIEGWGTRDKQVTTNEAGTWRDKNTSAIAALITKYNTGNNPFGVREDNVLATIAELYNYYKENAKNESGVLLKDK